MVTNERASVTITRLDREPAGSREGTVVWLRGEHDLANVAEVEAAIARAIALDEADLIVDLSAVEFLGSATVGAITRARDTVSVAARSVAVRSPSRCAHRTIDVCGLAALLDPAGAERARAAPRGS